MEVLINRADPSNGRASVGLTEWGPTGTVLLNDCKTLAGCRNLGR
jgi:hypothetical protein